MQTREQVIKGLEDLRVVYHSNQILHPKDFVNRHDMEAIDNALALLKAQETQDFSDKFIGLSEQAFFKSQAPRVMTLEEVISQEPGSVLWVEEAQSVVWNLFPLEIDVTSKHPDTGTHYLFFVTYHAIKKFECVEYNQVWRCWTSRPTDAQREATSWNT